MAVFNAAFPILPGKTDETRKFAAELTGGRRAEYLNSPTRKGLNRETWSLQVTPMGDFLLVWFDADDVEGGFAALAVSNEPIDVWFREQVLELSGIDMGAPTEGPMPELLADWRT